MEKVIKQYTILWFILLISPAVNALHVTQTAGALFLCNPAATVTSKCFIVRCIADSGIIGVLEKAEYSALSHAGTQTQRL